MEPAFYRGDLLFLTNPASEQYMTGDITVYKIPGADIPIVHRVIETHDVVSKGSVIYFLAHMQISNFVVKIYCRFTSGTEPIASDEGRQQLCR